MPSAVTLVISIVGAVTGMTGTTLAIWSLYRQIDRDKVKLRVQTSWGLSMSMPESPFLAVHVTNLSAFPVTIREVGVVINNDTERAIHPDATVSNGGRLPQRMEPRSSLTVSFPPEFLCDPKMKTARCAYAWTDCGERIESKGDDLPKMVSEAHNRRKPQAA